MDTDHKQEHVDDLDGLIEAATDFADDSIGALLSEARARMEKEIADDLGFCQGHSRICCQDCG